MCILKWQHTINQSQVIEESAYTVNNVTHNNKTDKFYHFIIYFDGHRILLANSQTTDCYK